MTQPHTTLFEREVSYFKNLQTGFPARAERSGNNAVETLSNSAFLASNAPTAPAPWKKGFW